MQEQEFERLIEALFDECKQIHKTKGKEYTQSDANIVKNFYVIADGIGLSPLHVWSVYFLKHVEAIKNFVKSGKVLSEETIRGRFVDAINYLFLGFAIIEDKDSEKKKS